MFLSQDQKELLINAIDGYFSYRITFFSENKRIKRYDGFCHILLVESSTDNFYIGLKKEKLVYFYRGENYYEPIPFFSKDEEQNDFLFEICSFCIENEIPFTKDSNSLLIDLPRKTTYITLRDKTSKQIIEMLEPFKYKL